MKIGIDLRPLQTSTKHRGIGYYIANLVENLLMIDDHNKYYLCYMNDAEPVSFKESDKCLLCPLDLTKDSTRNQAEATISDVIEKNEIDVFINTSPFEWDVKTPYRYPCRSIAIVYDLIPVLFYNQYLNHFPKDLQVEYFCNLQSLRNYDRLLAISECTKRDIVDFLDIRESRVDVIFAGINDRFHPVAGFNLEPIKRKYAIENDFFICTGGFDYRKNLEKLIEAFGLLCQKRNDLNLVIVCKLLDEQVTYLKRKAVEAYIPNGRLILTNFVPDEDLVMLYNASLGVVFPSIYEGFGLPVLEGMACGKPVITSNVSSLPEVCRGTGILVDPYDIKSICEAMLQLAADENLRKNMGDKCLSVALETGWDKVAYKTLSSLDMLYKKSTMPASIRSGQEKKYKIAYFSPLYPKKSGISDYSEELLPHLIEYADIDIFVDGYTPTNKRITEICNVFDYRSFEANARKYDMIIYQMGNSSYHEYMYPLIEKYPGLVVLHDFSLHGFIYSITVVRGDKERYIEEMQFSHGKVGELKALKNIKNVTMDDIYDVQFPVNRRVLYKSRGVIVHNKWAMDMASLYAGSVPIEMIAHGVDLNAVTIDPVEKEKLRSSLNIEENDVVFASFGFIAPTKRIIQSLSAFARLSKELPNAKYLLAGEMNKAMNEPIMSKIKECNLVNKVSITGYLDESMFNKYINVADVGVNLRYPICGETSGTLMKLISAGKPSIVSNIGPFKEFPDKFCLKVSIGDTEVDEIYTNMKTLAFDKDLRKSIGCDAKKYAKEHLSYSTAAERYIRFISMIID